MGFFEKIKAGLSKTRQSLQNTIGGMFAEFHGIDDDFYEELEETLIMGDLGIQRLGIFQRRAYLSLSDLRLEISLVFAADLSEKLIDI